MTDLQTFRQVDPIEASEITADYRAKSPAPHPHAAKSHAPRKPWQGPVDAIAMALRDAA